MAVLKTYEQILSDILTDYRNQFPDIDTAAGSLIFIRATALAAALFGLNKRAEYIETIPFPDKCARTDLEHWATIYGISNISQLTDGELVSAVLTAIRKPESGGNRYDWPRWAKTVSYDHGSWTEVCIRAWVFEGERGAGSIDVIVESDRESSPFDYDPWANSTAYVSGDIVTYDGNCWVTWTGGTSNGTNPTDDTGITDWDIADGSATPQLLAAVTTYINTRRPVGLADFVVRRAIKMLVTETITVYGTLSDAQLDQIEAETVSALMDVDAGGHLHIVRLISIAIENGAENVTVNPSSDLVCLSGPTVYERLWPYSINVVRG